MRQSNQDSTGKEHHGHGHGHGHGVGPHTDKKKLTLALVLLGGFMVGETIAAVLANSLALLSDAAHMLTDTASIAFALIAMSLSTWGSFGAYTFGLKRSGTLAASVNGLTLTTLGAYLAYEGVHRLIDPPEVEGLTVLVVGAIGIVVNLLATWTMAKADRDSLNVEGAFQHVLTDLYAFIGTTVSGVVVLTTGFTRADGIAALIVAALMLKAGVALVRESTRVFLQAAPRGVDPQEIGNALTSDPQVTEIDDLHIWEVASGFPALSAHVVVDDQADLDSVRHRLIELLGERFGIDHTTLQMTHTTAASHVESFAARGCPPRQGSNV
ncbi:cobalt-zinc-cadmium efflux system protein [Saccharopolyspora lacisalsi]|uniref:Cobalt-zinc-cadmium efflux system protein n=1 Tax=Halosaccharopolyspora lacisalsi TaxID=1000566 RepID=A0A839DZF0_9PSEU|nr:cation diffusion facilitator family transporter [Halosaccharopolyspora lacisalsi]MBA8824118.1 cobalt-zinc-cadmium efflux system protein [Halosaccharopolyspora lacisalsi]